MKIFLERLAETLNANLSSISIWKPPELRGKIAGTSFLFRIRFNSYGERGLFDIDDIKDALLSFDLDVTVPFVCHVVERDAPSGLDLSMNFSRLGDEAFDNKYAIGNAPPRYKLSFWNQKARFCEDYTDIHLQSLEKFKMEWGTNTPFRKCVDEAFAGFRACFPDRLIAHPHVLSFGPEGMSLRTCKEPNLEYGLLPERASVVLKAMSGIARSLGAT